jgi:BMFP domain-containing protein YqiC
MTGSENQQDNKHGLTDLLGRIVEEGGNLKAELGNSARAVAQSTLSDLDVVSRDEFDAQAAVLLRTREKVESLESEVARLLELLETKTDN